jgi:hypothetical protein
MVRNPLGIRIWFYDNENKIFVYLDLGDKYYSFNSNEVVISDYEADDGEQLIGPKTMVLWSEE